MSPQEKFIYSYLPLLEDFPFFCFQRLVISNKNEKLFVLKLSYSKKYLSQYKLQLPKLEIKDNCYEGRNIDLGGANIFSGQVFFILKNLLYSTFVFDFQL